LVESFGMGARFRLLDPGGLESVDIDKLVKGNLRGPSWFALRSQDIGQKGLIDEGPSEPCQQTDVARLGRSAIHE
jgi:hypothetical protein